MAFEAHIEFLLKTIAQEDSTSGGMNRLLDHCASHCPNDVWQGLRQLDIGHDVGNITAWLGAVLTAEPPPPTIVAFYFGLFDESEDGVQARCRLYVAGSERFDAADQSPEWAVDPAYFPEGRYSPSSVLVSLSAAAQGCGSDEARELIEYVLCLGYASLAVKESRRNLAANPELNRILRKPVAVGFDSGDVFLLPSDPEALGSSSSSRRSKKDDSRC